MSSIGYVSILLVLIYYVYAILGCMAFAANDPWHFRDVFNAMLTLVRASTFEDWTDVMAINMYGCGMLKEIENLLQHSMTFDAPKPPAPATEPRAAQETSSPAKSPSKRKGGVPAAAQSAS